MAYGGDAIESEPVRNWLTDWDWLDDGWGENAIVAMINNGKTNQMPAQAHKLTEGQIHVLASYVWGLSNVKAGAAQ